MPAATMSAARVSAPLKQELSAVPARARAAVAARPAHPAGCRCPAHGRRSVAVRGEQPFSFSAQDGHCCLWSRFAQLRQRCCTATSLAAAAPVPWNRYYWRAALPCGHRACPAPQPPEPGPSPPPAAACTRILHPAHRSRRRDLFCPLTSPRHLPLLSPTSSPTGRHLPLTSLPLTQIVVESNGTIIIGPGANSPATYPTEAPRETAEVEYLTGE